MGRWELRLRLRSEIKNRTVTNLCVSQCSQHSVQLNMVYFIASSLIFLLFLLIIVAVLFRPSPSPTNLRSSDRKRGAESFLHLTLFAPHLPSFLWRPLPLFIVVIFLGPRKNARNPSCIFKNSTRSCILIFSWNYSCQKERTWRRWK